MSSFHFCMQGTSRERLIHAFVSSKLDYCNSILLGLPSYELEKLQRLQNTAARLTVRAKKVGSHHSSFEEFTLASGERKNYF